MRRICVALALVLVTPAATWAQDGSVETFNAIRLEHSSNKGATIQLSAPTGVTSYSLEFPSTAAPTNRRYGLSVSAGNSGSMSWFATPLGSSGQIPVFESDEEITGSPRLLWSKTNHTMTITSEYGNAALYINKQLTSPAVADTARALVVNGGRSGFGTVNPNTQVDIAGDIALREYNYTGSLSSTNDAMNFDGKGNLMSFLRVSSSLTGEVTFKGIAGGQSGKILRIHNATGQTLRFKHKQAAVSANNIKTSTGSDLLLTSNNTYEFMYSSVEGCWMVTFSGPSELSQYASKDVGPITNGTTLPTSTASYLQVSTESALNKYNVTLADGATAGQILVVQNKGPKVITFTGSNVALSSANSDLSINEAIVFIWSGSKWIQVARAQN